MAQVKISTEVTGGTGVGVFISVGDHVLHFTSSGSQTVELEPQYYVAQVAGSEPSDANIIIKFKQGNRVLKEASFSESVFWALMAFKVD